jgi:hypothetical protein
MTLLVPVHRNRGILTSLLPIFFRDCILLNFEQNFLNFMQNLLNFMQNFLFSKMPNSHDITALTHRVCDIFNDILHLATPTYKQTRFRSRSNLSFRFSSGVTAHWSSLTFWNNSNQCLKKLDMTFKYTNVNMISIIRKNIDIPIYRKFQYRVIGIYKKR